MKTVNEIIKDLKKEVEQKYYLLEKKPAELSKDEFDVKRNILAEMFKTKVELGLSENEMKAFCQLAELYKKCGSWY